MKTRPIYFVHITVCLSSLFTCCLISCCWSFVFLSESDSAAICGTNRLRLRSVRSFFFQPSWANKTKLFPSSIRLPIISLNCFAYETKVISEKSNRLWWTLQNSRMLSHEERALKMRTQEGQNTVWLWHKQIHFGFINWVLLFCFASCVFITKRGSSNSYPGGGALTISCLALFLYLVKYSTRLLLLSISL